MFRLHNYEERSVKVNKTLFKTANKTQHRLYIY